MVKHLSKQFKSLEEALKIDCISNVGIAMVHPLAQDGSKLHNPNFIDDPLSSIFKLSETANHHSHSSASGYCSLEHANTIRLNNFNN